MNYHTRLMLACLPLLFFFGCAKPSTVRVIRSPISSVFLTIETYNGNGPVSAGDMRLYAHFSQDGETDRQLILDGENLTISKLSWEKPNELVICLSGGITDTFRNEVTLIIGRSDRSVHSSLRENC
jgi:hypothetical protein